MGEPFVGEIRLLSFAWVPSGWVVCDGRSLSISANQALYSLLGIRYGGDGKTNFQVPDLRGRVPLASQTPGQLVAAGGTESVTLTAAQMPPHTHAMQANTAATGLKPIPANNVYAQAPAGSNIYGSAANTVALNAGTLSNAGGGLAHDNMQPFLVVNYCIATTGIYPSRP